MPARITDDQRGRDREALLDAAEALLYEHGIHAVGMDQVRAAAGLPLKRIYDAYASKDDLVVAVLRRRDGRWRGRLAAYVDGVADPQARVLAVFDWLHEWFAEPGFRGCMWINAHGELGSASAAIHAEVSAHKAAFHDQIETWVSAIDPALTEPVYLLAEGAMVTAGITGDPQAARHAQRAVEALLAAHGAAGDSDTT